MTEKLQQTEMPPQETEMTELSVEEILEKCGGFGKFQWFMLLAIYVAMPTINWSLMHMAYAGQCYVAENIFHNWACDFRKKPSCLLVTLGLLIFLL